MVDELPGSRDLRSEPGRDSGERQAARTAENPLFPQVEWARGACVNRPRGSREWVSQTANPVAFAPHLRKDPLPGLPVRPVLFQFAIGDEIAPNPTTSAILRAGDLADRAVFFRNDLAFAEDPAVPKNPHGFMLRIDSTDPLVQQIAFGAQEQLATFLASDEAVIIHPEPSRLFEELIDLKRLGDLNFLP